MMADNNGEKVEMTAAEALGAVLKHTVPMGLEVIIPRKITVREITRIYLARRGKRLAVLSHRKRKASILSLLVV